MPEDMNLPIIEGSKEKRTGRFHLRKGVGIHTIYMLHKQAMYRVALKALDGDREKAQDVVKKAFLMIARHLDQIEGENSKRTKALMIAAVKSVLNDVYHETRIRVGIPDRYENPRATQRDILRVNQILTRNDFLADLAKYAEKLTFQERELLFYIFFAKWSYEEVAKHTGIRAFEVGPRVFRAKQKIARLMTNGTVD